MNTTLTEEEKKLAEDLGFEKEVLVVMKECVGTPLTQYNQKRAVTSFDLPRERALSIVRDNHEKLRGAGYFMFIGKLDADIVLDVSTSQNAYMPTNEVTLIKSDDQYDILRTMETTAGYYGHTTDDIIAKLKEWDRAYSLGLKVIGAEFNSVRVAVAQAPKDVEKFTTEVFEFAPDVVDDMLLMGQPLAGIEEQNKYARDAFMQLLENKREFWMWWD